MTRKRGTGTGQAGTYAQVLGGVGTLLAGVAAVIALVIAGGRGEPAATPGATIPPATSAAPVSPTAASSSVDPSAAASPSEPPSPAASPSIPVFGTLVFEHAMTSEIPGVPAEASYAGCTQRLAPDRGYAIAAEGRALTCQFPLSGATSQLTELFDVRIDVRVDIDRFTPAAAADYTPGGPTVLCRMSARERGGTHYSAVLGPNGFWQIDRYVDGVAEALGFGTDPALATEPGGTRRLRLECAGTPGGATLVRWSVDGREVATETDPDGLPPGTVGLGVVDYPGPEVAVTFHEVEIRTP